MALNKARIIHYLKGTDEEIIVKANPMDEIIAVDIFKPITKWKLPYGLKVGMSLQELEAINGKPLSFYGFEWDNGGLVFDWNKGNLETKNISCMLGYKGNMLPEFVGDQVQDQF